MFLVKKIVANFIFPMPVIVMLLAVGILLLWFSHSKKKQHFGRWLVTVGGILLFFLSNIFFANHLLKPIESKIKPSYFQLQNFKERVGKYPVRYVVVLGGGHTTDPTLPVTSHLSGSSLVRVVEGIRLYRYFTSSKLLLSGGSVYEKTPEAESMATVAMDLGVKPEDIILEDKSRDTKDQAIKIRNIVGDSLFVLVTSASHMPRAMAMFEKQGLNPFPAPTDHQVRRSSPGNPAVYFPSATNFGKSETAVYELIGFLWARLRGQTGGK